MVLFWFRPYKPTDDTDARKANHSDWRDDRPPHGRGGPADRDGLEQHPCLTASSPSMAFAHQLRNPRFLSTVSSSQ